MEEDQRKEAQLAINIQFDKHPLLPTLIKKPTYYLQSSWTQLVGQQIHSQFGTAENRDYYRLVYNPGTTGELMSIQSGPLAGLKTTSVVEKGRISSVAGLKKVDGQLSRSLLPMLLTMGALRSIYSRLNYITDICTDIRNRQISGDKAKLERISEVIVDCFESVSEGDERLNEANLRRVTANTDDCFEILSAFLDDLTAQHQAKVMDYESVDERISISWGAPRSLPNPTNAIRELMGHSVFAAYERYAAGRVCQVVLSGSHSQGSIGRHKAALERVRDSIRKIFDERLQRHERGVEFFQKKINDVSRGYDEGNWTVETAQSSLEQQKRVIRELKSELHTLLDARLADFDAIVKIFKKGRFEIIVIDGAMIFGEEDFTELGMDGALSSDELLVGEQTARASGSE